MSRGEEKFAAVGSGIFLNAGACPLTRPAHLLARPRSPLRGPQAAAALAELAERWDRPSGGGDLPYPVMQLTISISKSCGLWRSGSAITVVHWRGRPLRDPNLLSANSSMKRFLPSGCCCSITTGSPPATILRIANNLSRASESVNTFVRVMLFFVFAEPES